uniref:Ring finger protein 182 n=1 Tax=Eptatretus burgeri TaxID=7764 RepID=A0A8C4NCI8_EPTBU
MLACRHIVCARCLAKIVAATNVSPIAADIETHVPCPFCRHGTDIQGAGGVAALPEAQALLFRMHIRRQRLRLCHQQHMSEMVLNTEGLNTSTAPTQAKDGLVPDDTSSLLSHPVIWTSQESPGEMHHSSLCSRVPRILFWLLCIVYFSSLPLGIYLLVMERVSIGVALVNMLPATLVLCLIYGLCRWLCQEPYLFCRILPYQ